MKRSNVSPTLFDDDEIEVANILLDLRNLIRQSDVRLKLRGFTLSWGCKRRRSNTNRSATVSPPPPPPPTTAGVNSPSPSPPPPEDSHADPEIPAIKTEVLSPATPLSFSPSESSDEKPVIVSSRKHSKKRTREEWMKNLDELNQCKEALIGQLETVRAYYNKQMAYNLELKAKKQEILSISQKVEEPSGPDTRAGQGYPQYENPIIIDPLGQRYQYQFVQNGPRQDLVSAQNGMGYVLGPIGIPDLNVSPEETLVVGSSQPFDVQRMEGGDKKTRYAEARRNRMVKNKLKIKSGSHSITLPCRR
ncbi:PREDICTED: uncharacterized protein LOC109153037 isoform X2 [Ipomoea nil]|nr:PREDICTED: uncharacterized protein LOC109153037 isoform X2 [Ipomoea nil]